MKRLTNINDFYPQQSEIPISELCDFAEPQFRWVTQNNMSVDFLYSSVSRHFQNISELMTEWYSLQTENIETFLTENGLIQFFGEQQFIDIATGHACFPKHFVPLLYIKQPFQISLDNLYNLNSKSHLNYTPELKIDVSAINNALRLYKKQTEQNKRLQRHNRYFADLDESRRKKRILNRKYRETHRDEINARNYAAYHANIELSRAKRNAYARANRDMINARNRKNYYADIDATHQKAAAYRAANREKLREQSRIRYHTDIEQTHAKRAEYHARNRDKINARRREKYNENKELYNSYSAKYRETHREEIRERNRIRTQTMTDEQRQKNAEKSRRYRERHKEKLEQQRTDPAYIAKRREISRRYNEKRRAAKILTRFQTQTGPVILSLLDAITHKR